MEGEKQKVDQVRQLADLSHDRYKFIHTVMDGFVVIQNHEIKANDEWLKQRIESRRSERMSIFIVTGGEARINLNMQDYNIKENTLVLMSPNTIMSMSSIKKSCTLSGVSFTIDFMSEIGMPEDATAIFSFFSSRFSPIWNIEKEDTKLINQLIQRLVEHTAKYAIHPFGKEILIHNFFIFLYELAAMSQQYSKMIRMNFTRQERLIIAFGNLAREQFREVRTVKKYADQLNVSAKYLSEIVKEYSGKNASEIINDLVILEAKFLLSRSQLSIGEIADNLNFSDQSFFGKYFKRHTGMSPKAYRESEF
ncbi:helix-turn-helix domain-containing protein [Albibacterium indicum]|uniref:helix-turn-helix domain-containing protein n=1 Tax=Albibacterium indicum TaxID=2292082 RepID=UPI0019822E0E|nr:helix-turn-helix domain-containing protein [Pedobacter indicus]